MTGEAVQITWTVQENKIPALIANLETQVEAIVAKAALDIQANAQDRAPVDTGTLKNSIQAVRDGTASWRVVVGVDYGIYVEYGTVHMAAQPYLTPAVAVVRPQFLAALAAVVKP